jgi:hypothetical protein
MQEFRKTIFVAVLCTASLISGSASADVSWGGPGWYAIGGGSPPALVEGPYQSKDACDAVLNQDPMGLGECKYFSAPPTG